MTTAHPLNLRTRLFVGSVIACSAAAAADMVLRAAPRPDDSMPLVVFGGLGLLATAVSLARRTSRATRITHQVGSAFVYPLLLLVDPVLVAAVLLLTTVCDALLNHRRATATAFNVGQLWLATWGATAVTRYEWLRFGPAHGSQLAGAVATLLVFALANHLLAYVVTGLANRQAPGFRNWIVRVGLLNETLCLVSGLAMAVFWVFEPWLVLLAILPLAIIVTMVFELARREQALEDRESELRSLQGLGLEIGSELDGERLAGALLRRVKETLHASGALLAVPSESGESLRVRAHLGIVPAPPDRLEVSGIDPALFDRGRPIVVDAEECRRRFPAVAGPIPDGGLLAPLEIRERRGTLLVLAEGPERRGFGEHDVRRIEILSPFLDVALSNSDLVQELAEIQSRMAQTERMSAIGLLVSGVTHELNNPLTGVLGFAELLAERETDERRLRMLERIRQEARRAAGIVRNLQIFARRHRPERALVDLNAVADDVLEFRANELRVRISPVRRLDPDLPLVHADPSQLQQVLLHLLTNAVQAIERSGRPGSIFVSTTATEEVVRLSVEDDGTGIDEGLRRKIFHPFFSTREVGSGTGLGLSICYGIVDSHGGRLDVSSSEARGATFTVSLPRPGSRTETEPVGASDGPTARANVGRSLLLVSADESIRAMLRTHLASRGWEVVTAEDGPHARQLASRHEFAGLVVDLQGPGSDDRDAVERIRAAHPNLAACTVLLTGDDAAEAQKRSASEPPPAILRKPLDLALLDRTLGERIADGGSDAGVA